MASGRIKDSTVFPGTLQSQECCGVGGDEQKRKAGKSSWDRPSFLLTGFLGRGKEEQSRIPSQLALVASFPMALGAEVTHSRLKG